MKGAVLERVGGVIRHLGAPVSQRDPPSWSPRFPAARHSDLFIFILVSGGVDSGYFLLAVGRRRGHRMWAGGNRAVGGVGCLIPWLFLAGAP